MMTAKIKFGFPAAFLCSFVHKKYIKKKRKKKSTEARHYTRQGNATVFENTFKSTLNYLNTQYPDCIQTSRKYCTLGPCSSAVQVQAHARVRLTKLLSPH